MTLREEFERNFTERGEVGASFAATVEGEFVADLWAGHRDAAGTLPWEDDTLVCVFSVTKTMTALCALLLVDRGELSFDAPVTHYWPEYGQNGKETTEVRHIMGHSAGLPDFGEPLTHVELYDWEHVIGVLERQAPAWRPGEDCAYHALTQGFLVGEIVRRITGLHRLASSSATTSRAPSTSTSTLAWTPGTLLPHRRNARQRRDAGQASPLHEGASVIRTERSAASYQQRRIPPRRASRGQRPRQRPFGGAGADGSCQWRHGLWR